MNGCAQSFQKNKSSCTTITVVIATHNGSRTLEKTLEAFRKLDVLNISYDIVIVDNASTDQTNNILKNFTGCLPLSIVYEPRRGKNIALNRVISDIKSDLIVFTDDDVVPRPDWLVVLQKAAEQENDYFIFGGKIIPRWPSPPPSLLLSEEFLSVAFAVTPSRLIDGPVDPRNVWGPNMCVRREVFRSGLRFDEAVGPTHGNYIMGSETDFTVRAHKRGFKCWHVNNAVVEHLIREEQLDLRWIVRRARRYGRGLAHEERHNNVKFRRAFGVPLGVVYKYFKGTILSQWHRLNGNERMWFINAYSANRSYGFILEDMRRFARNINICLKRLLHLS